MFLNIFITQPLLLRQRIWKYGILPVSNFFYIHLDLVRFRSPTVARCPFVSFLKKQICKVKNLMN